MPIKDTLKDDVSNFVLERISNTKNDDFFMSLPEYQRGKFADIEQSCYLRGFVDGIYIATGGI